MKRRINSIVLLLFLICISCRKVQVTDNQYLLSPECFTEKIFVKYMDDSIIIINNDRRINPFVKESSQSSKIFYEEHRWVFVKGDGGFFWISSEGGKELFLSHDEQDSTYQKGEIGSRHTIVTERYIEEHDTLFKSTLFFSSLKDNYGKEVRSPYFCLVYDKDYKIKKVRKWIHTVDYVAWEE